MKILLAVDDSKFSEAAVRDVAEQTRREGSEVLVVHALPPVTVTAPPQMAPGYAPELEAAGKEGRALVERVAQTLRSAGFKAETAVLFGDVREAIVDRAAAWGADLIVLGSHGRRGASRFLLGSVAESVARHAPCSVKIVRLPAAH
jgi:nucleotide-binding universal stress UspA family protein